MIVVRSRWATAVALTLALPLGALAAGCGGAPAPIPEAPAPPPKARNAAEIAWDIIHAQVGLTIYVDRIRGRPITAKIESLELFRFFLEGTGIRAETALDRVYIASPRTNQASEWLVVFEHRLPNDRVKAALDVLLREGRLVGAWVDPPGSVPIVRFVAHERDWALALVEPNFLILLPGAHAIEAARFVGTGGFPDPTGPEALSGRALDPSNTLLGPGVPRFPSTLQSGVSSITLTADEGLDVTSSAQSTSPEQATADAEALSKSVEAATSIKVAFMRFRLFKPIPFTAEGDQVKSSFHLTQGEIDTLLGALAAILPR